MFEHLKNLIASRRLYLRTVEELHGLTDRDLHDLSINRSDIEYVAHKAAYEDQPVVTAAKPALNRRAFA